MRALVLDQAVAVLIVVVFPVVLVLLVVLVVLVLGEERLLQIADVAVDLLDILLKLVKLRTGILMLGGEGLHRVDHGQQQLALIAFRVQAHALGQALQIGHLFTHLAHRGAAFLPLTRGTCRSRRGYPRGSCRRC